ncbi:MAG: restriction endonuclease [Gammaproteobacteria bacterium]|nr:restriction endonuclease [Gammaproteobacteria bacterium]MYF29409.1 restriction endonuclease [Gammaproteobacteria bacterium]MYK47906.1 restriction endonuclease [Gammaproteobacteria bacterium]
MADLESVLSRLDNLRRGRHRGEYAPHKPLLLLYALGRLSEGDDLVAYRDVDPVLRTLLRDFGPPRQTHHSEYPFWRLQNDELWQVTSKGQLQSRASNKDPKKSELLNKGAVGAFAPDVKEVILADRRNLTTVARKLLEDYFPSTLHEDILDAVGLSLDMARGRPKRSRDFRQRVLRAYENRCSVCGFDIRLGEKLAGLEAAHIMWHTADGPDEESNGLALCVLHHKAFDLGAFTVDVDLRTIVCSQELSGTMTDWVLGYHGKGLRAPQSRRYFPEKQFVEWHRASRFRGPPRDL